MTQLSIPIGFCIGHILPPALKGFIIMINMTAEVPYYFVNKKSIQILH